MVLEMKVNKVEISETLEKVLPGEIENRSMEIIQEEISHMGQMAVDRWNSFSTAEKNVVKRAIHTSADFDYLDNIYFSMCATEKIMDAMKKGCTIVTDTNMAKAGINKPAAKALGCQVECFMADDDVALKAKEAGTTRAIAAIEKAATLSGPVIFAVGNAPTALVKIHEMVEKGQLNPVGVIGIPVGFVNVVAAKNIIVKDGEIGRFSTIVGRGRKGGSNVAAAIINALMYMCTGRI